MNVANHIKSWTALWLVLGLGVAQSNAQTTVSFQPDATAGKDAMVYTYAPTTNYGTYTLHRAFRWTIGGQWNTIRSYIEYDLSSIPTNAIVTNADLYLYGDGHNPLSGSNAVYISTASGSWSESTIHWNNQPGFSTTDQKSLAQTTSSTQNDLVDVTTHVQSMVNSPATNYGWCMHLQDEASNNYRDRRYGTSDHATASKRPKLEVTYVLPMSLSVNVTHSNFGANDGAIDLTVTDGLPPYTYSWSNAATTEDVSSLAPGAYTVKVTDALSKTATLIVVVLEYGNSVTIPVQFGPDYVQDAYLSGHPNYDDGNYGTLDRIQSLYWTSGGVFEGRSILKIDVHGVPATANLTSANLTLQGRDHNPLTQSNAATLRRATADWDETTVTWNNQPATTTTNSVALAQSTSSTQDYTLDLTTHYQAFFDGTYPNYGFLLDGDVNAIYSKLVFHSSYAASSSDWPELELVFSLPQIKNYASLQKGVNGGYYTVSDGNVQVLFHEKYEPGANAKLQYNIYDESRTLVGAVDAAGAASITGSPVVGIVHGKNWLDLDLSALSLSNANYYLLEVINAKGDKTFLRFKYHL